MYNILKYTGFVVLFLLFVGTTFFSGYLSEMSTTFLSIKTNLIDPMPTELFFLVNSLIIGMIILFFRNF